MTGLKQILARLIGIEKRLDDLEAKAALGQKLGPKPYVPDYPNSPTYPIYPIQPIFPVPDNSDNAHCGLCGNRYKDMTHYVCSHPQCPSRINISF